MNCTACEYAVPIILGAGINGRHSMRCMHPDAGIWRGRVLMNPRKEPIRNEYEAPAWCPRRKDCDSGHLEKEHL